MAQRVNSKTITSANVVASFRCSGVYDDWVPIQGATPDAFIGFDEVQRAEVQVGVDNEVSYGYTPFVSNININLQANSPTVPLFDRICARFDIDSEVSLIEIMVTLPSVGINYYFEGTISNSPGGINASRLLEGVSYKLAGRVERGE